MQWVVERPQSFEVAELEVWIFKPAQDASPVEKEGSVRTAAKSTLLTKAALSCDALLV
jgi:hypothetical protein